LTKSSRNNAAVAVVLILVILLIAFLELSGKVSTSPPVSSKTIAGPSGYSYCYIPQSFQPGDYVTSISGLYAPAVPNGAGGYFYDYFEFSYTIAADAPYCLDSAGDHVAFIGFQEQLYQGSTLVDTEYYASTPYAAPADQAPGSTYSGSAVFPEYFAYPGYPPGSTWTVVVSPYDCLLYSGFPSSAPASVCPATGSTYSATVTLS